MPRRYAPRNDKENMKLSKFSVLAAVPLFAVLLSGCGKEVAVPYAMDLEVWGVFDDSDAYNDIFSGYQKLNQSHIEDISYRKMPEDTYREDLIRAFAEGKGPDIFMIRNAWLPLFENLIAPAPEYQMNEKEFREAFVDVVADDSLVNGKIHAVPLSVDSLALYYNKDIFDAAGIVSPPPTWGDLARNASQLGRIDVYGNILQSGVSLGTAKNINRSTDILLALALQSGLSVEQNGFWSSLQLSDKAMADSLESYAQFAQVGSQYYSWNPRQHYSTDAFYEGTLAMMVNYSWKIEEAKRKNAKLDFGVAPLPQVAGAKPSNYANYWTFVVAKSKELPPRGVSVPSGKYNPLRIHESWQLLHYLAFPHPSKSVVLRNPLSPNLPMTVAVEGDPAAVYLERTGKPAARRDLVEKQKTDPWLSPFAYGNLIAKSWRPGDIERAEGILAEAMESVSRGENTVQGALQTARGQIELFDRPKETAY